MATPNFVLYLAKEWQHVVQLVIPLLFVERVAGVRELGEQLFQVHQSECHVLRILVLLFLLGRAGGGGGGRTAASDPRQFTHNIHRAGWLSLSAIRAPP